MFLLLAILTVLGIQSSYADVCNDWFSHSGIPKSSDDCEIRCAALDTGMDTFVCPSSCHQLCLPDKKCPPNPEWVKRIKAGKPDKWPVAGEVTKDWTAAEKEMVLSALNLLPEQLQIQINGIFRMKTSVDLVNPASIFDNSIVLYDRAFVGHFSLPRVIAHELAHAMYTKLSLTQVQNYQAQLGWLDAKGEMR
jgi:hypothetical protein